MQIIIIGNNIIDNTAALMSANILAATADSSVEIHLLNDGLLNDEKAQHKGGLARSNIPPLNLTTDIATVAPSFAACLRLLKVSEAQFMHECDAQFHLGNHFVSWGEERQNFHHVFSDYGVKFATVEFLPAYLRLLSEQQTSNTLDSYSLAAQMAQRGVFSHPSDDPKSIRSSLNYSWRFSIAKFNALLTAKLDQHKITQHSHAIEQKLRNDSGDITQIQLQNKQIIDCDLVIDCQGKEAPPTQAAEPTLHYVSGIKPLNQHSSVNLYTGTQHGFSVQCLNNTHEQFTQYYWSTSGWPTSYWKTSDSQTGLGDNIKQSFTQEHPSYTAQSQGQIELDLAPPQWQNQQLDLSPLNRKSLSIHSSHLDLLWYTLSTLCNITRHNMRSTLAAKAFNRELTQVTTGFNELNRLTLFPLISGMKNKQTKEDETFLSKEGRERLELFQHCGRVLQEEGDQFPPSYYATLLYGLGITPNTIDPLAYQQDQESLAKTAAQLLRLIDNACKNMPKLS